MLRMTFATFALICLAGLSSAAAGNAQSSPRATYVAKLAAPSPSARSFIVRDRLWRCDTGGTCLGPASTSPAVACGLVAQQVGPLAGFEANGRALDADALARCNARAR